MSLERTALSTSKSVHSHPGCEILSFSSLRKRNVSKYHIVGIICAKDCNKWLELVSLVLLMICLLEYHIVSANDYIAHPLFSYKFEIVFKG